jgi:hypothetical protein
VWGSYEADVFAVGEQGYILHYNGSGWSRMSSDTKERLEGVWGTSPYDVFAVGFEGTILHYDGNAWSTMDSGITEDLWGVWGSSPSDVYAAGKVWGNSSSDVFILGGVEGTVLHYDGNAWSPISVYSNIYPDSLWVWGSRAYTILHYNGDTWAAMIIGTTEDIRDVWGSSSSDVFVVGGSGTILHYPQPPRPEIASISPGQLNRGSTMDVTIIGSRFAGATAVSFGPGISVNEFTVVSSSKIVVDITVSANAAAGTRDVSVTTPEGTGQLASGLEVREEREESRGSEEGRGTGTSGIGLGVGWGLVALCIGIGYYLLRRNAGRTRN